MDKVKRKFQKVISSIRKDIGGSSYPKAMMTMVQMERGQATVNCGGEWLGVSRTIEIAHAVMFDERFVSFIEEVHARAVLEVNNFGTYQIRIHFNER